MKDIRTYQLEDSDRVYYMDVKMASEYLHVARSTIYKWVEENYIPHKKLHDKKILFIKNDIDLWVQNNGMLVEDLPEVPKSLIGERTPRVRTQFARVTTNPRLRVMGSTPLKYRNAG